MSVPGGILGARLGVILAAGLLAAGAAQADAAKAAAAKVTTKAAQPDAALCHAAADTFVDLAPGLDGQTGVATGDELLASDDRWPLVVTGYTYAAERLERHDRTDDWGRLVLASDQLIECFSHDPDRAGGEMEVLKKDFDALFPAARRAALVRQAAADKG